MHLDGPPEPVSKMEKSGCLRRFLGVFEEKEHMAPGLLWVTVGGEKLLLLLYIVLKLLLVIIIVNITIIIINIITITIIIVIIIINY